MAYSVLSGMKDFALALNVGHVVAGTGFGVAGLMGLLGIHQLVLCSGLRIEREIGIVAGSLVPVLITGYQVLGLYLVDGYGAAVFGLCVVLVTLAVASIAPHLKASGDSLKSSSIWSHSTLSLVGLAFSSAPSLAVCILAALAQNATVPIWPAYVAIVPTFIMSSWVMLTFQRVVENPPEAVIEPAVELAEKISLEGPRVNSAETGK
ncbi:hypothetical protein Aph02nite_25670 [Actinoplanes philippinensis]|nr:hypothetical protein Aph02nite_25670 [Actinoplanes philippinensis]